MDLPKEGLDSNGGWALRYTKALSFPRKTGTEGEKKAAQTLVQTLDGPPAFLSIWNPFRRSHQHLKRGMAPSYATGYLFTG